MRDSLCIEEECRKGIKLNKRFLEENKEEIIELVGDEQKGIQRLIRVLLKDYI